MKEVKKTQSSIFNETTFYWRIEMKNINHLLVIVDPTVERDFVIAKAKLLVDAYKPKVTFFINNDDFLAHDR